MANEKISKKSILIVEDEPAILKILARKMNEIGCEVRTAKDGEEALKEIQKNRPDLTLLDVMLPKRDGLDVLRTVRDKYGYDLPIIIISNLDVDEDIKVAKNLGVIDYIIKSNISLEDLMDQVLKVLKD